MSQLDRLLKAYAPPPVPAGLAQRAVAEAIKHPQQRIKTLSTPGRRDRRGGWKRPLWIGAASLGLAFTSAVAASVVSGGRIEIPVVQPVVQEVVEAVPVLHQAQARRAPERLAAAAREEVELPKAAETPQPIAEAPGPGQPGWRKVRVMQKLTVAKQVVEQRRAAGMPTPRADRIERQAKQIVERRQAAGLPTPSIEEVEAGLALRDMRRMWFSHRAGRLDPAMLTDQQLARIADRLPPQKRERFMALSSDMQRQLVARTLEQMRARRAMRQTEAEPQVERTQPVVPVEPVAPANLEQ